MELAINTIINGDWVEVLKTLPSNLVHCCVTSPPYYGQRLYGWGGDGSCEEKEVPHKWQPVSDSIQLCQKCGMQAPILGLESTPEEHIEKLVVGFRELKRVLRDDGILFLNEGDKYNGGGCGNECKNSRATSVGARCNQLQNGDLLMLPARIALALREDGWVLRSDTIWAKALSFCPTYSGSTTPESMSGTSWQKHKIKIGTKIGDTPKGWRTPNGDKVGEGNRRELIAVWQDCPGCPKCSPNDGYVLRHGSWRPTSAHEHLFIFTKGKYFSDMEAVREENSSNTHEKGSKLSPPRESVGIGHKEFARYCPGKNNPSGRNLRNVWCINPQAYKGSHYATFPEDLVEPCIKVATSEKGVCPKCGKQWARVVDISGGTIGKSWHDHSDDIGKGMTQQQEGKPLATWKGQKEKENPYNRTTLGWRATCKCNAGEPVPAVVFDPFSGSGTVAAVAAKLGRNYLGIEINPDYIKDQSDYRVAEAETGITISEQKTGQKGLFEKVS